MSPSYSDCFNDLLCCEESSEIISSGDSRPESSSEVECSDDAEESIACFIEDERNFVPGFDYLSRLRSRYLDVSAREESVAWILKVQAYYRFQPLTAYLSVNYLDRFLYSRSLPRTSGWPLQLLSVACLSLAAKMEEPLVPSLLDLQVEGAKYIFAPRTIRRMEILVLSVLDWKLRSVTPFSFIGFFACKLDASGAYIGFLISRATEIVLSNMQEASFLEHWPSSIAAAAILCAANEIPKLSLVDPEHAESWCDGLSKEKVISCYQLMQDLVLGNSRQRKTPKCLPLLRVTIQATMRSSDSTSFSSSSPPPPPSSSSTSTSRSSFSVCCKRRKLNNCSWVDDDRNSE